MEEIEVPILLDLQVESYIILQIYCEMFFFPKQITM
jgi:hypothetical protein